MSAYQGSLFLFTLLRHSRKFQYHHHILPQGNKMENKISIWIPGGFSIKRHGNLNDNQAEHHNLSGPGPKQRALPAFILHPHFAPPLIHRISSPTLDNLASPVVFRMRKDDLWRES